MIDLHVHILPGLDDGPGTIEESVALAKAAFKAGTRTLVATPHVLNLFDENRNSLIVREYARLKKHLESELPGLVLLLGTEIYFRPGLSELVQLEAATINNTGRYIMVEFPLVDLPGGFEKELENLRSNGVIPIIAHPERTIAVLKKPALIGRMIGAGAVIQINAGSLTGFFGRSVRKMAHNLLCDGWVHVIASDAHGVDGRIPSLKAAISAATESIGEAAARCLVDEHPRAILEGLPWPGNKAGVLIAGGIS